MKIIIIIYCAEQQLALKVTVCCSLRRLAECSLAQVASPNIKSLFRMHWAKLSSAGAEWTHTYTYKSDNLIYHCTLSGTETGAVHTHIHVYSRVSTDVCVCARELCVVPLVRLLVASQNRSWKYGWECNVPYFRSFMSALLVPGSQAGHPSMSSIFWTNCGTRNEWQRVSQSH